jgi:hypothetical protein
MARDVYQKAIELKSVSATQADMLKNENSTVVWKGKSDGCDILKIS